MTLTLTHELTPIPHSLAHADGSLRKATKSNLLHLLETEVTTTESLPLSAEAAAWIIDGMALVQKNKPTLERNFGDYASSRFESVLKHFEKDKCLRIDIVFDPYDVKNSIKSSERDRRRSSDGIYVHIHGPQTPLPKQWSKFLDEPRNKGNLASFLSTYWCEVGPDRVPDGKSLYLGSGFEGGNKVVCISNNGISNIETLSCNQEDADTRMLLHAQNCIATCKRIVVESPDTDVAVLCTYYFGHLVGLGELYFHTGVVDKQRFIPVHELSHNLGSLCTGLLLPFHAITGCDTTSSVGRLGKVKPWKLLRKTLNCIRILPCLERPFKFLKLQWQSQNVSFVTPIARQGTTLKSMTCGMPCFANVLQRLKNFLQQQTLSISMYLEQIFKHTFGNELLNVCWKSQIHSLTDGGIQGKELQLYL